MYGVLSLALVGTINKEIVIAREPVILEIKQCCKWKDE